MDGELRKHFAVDADTALLESVHETGIADFVHVASGIDTLDPKFAEIALHIAAGNISIAKAVEDLLFGRLE